MCVCVTVVQEGGGATCVFYSTPIALMLTLNDFPPNALLSALCSLLSALCSLLSALCSLLSALCSLLSVLCSLFSAFRSSSCVRSMVFSAWVPCLRLSGGYGPPQRICRHLVPAYRAQLRPGVHRSRRSSSIHQPGTHTVYCIPITAFSVLQDPNNPLLVKVAYSRWLDPHPNQTPRVPTSHHSNQCSVD